MNALADGIEASLKKHGHVTMSNDEWRDVVTALRSVPSTEHVLYETSDPDRPDVICDGNGEVVLGLCRKCGRGEIELEGDGGACPGRREHECTAPCDHRERLTMKAVELNAEIDTLRTRVTELLQFNNEFEQRARDAERRVKELEALINSPETTDWMAGVPLEAAHQVKRYGVNHDAGKSPSDWFWLIGYLSGKALASAMLGNIEKAKHHTISTGAALLNWHRALTGENTAMRPGIMPPAEAAA